jgi:hypothetical protein
MHCFNHRDVAAVGICRACSKGLCPECVNDLGHSISCRGSCEAKAQTLHSQVAQNSVVLRTQRRNRFFAPAMFMVMGAALMIYASDGRSLLNLGTVMGGSFVLFGIVLLFLVQRYAKELDRKV